MTFYIRKDRKMGGYVIVRVGYPYEYHSHVKKMDGAHQVIRMIDRGIEPNKEWLRVAVRRLLTDDEYRRLKKKKQPYRNRRARYG